MIRKNSNQDSLVYKALMPLVKTAQPTAAPQAKKPFTGLQDAVSPNDHNLEMQDLINSGKSGMSHPKAKGREYVIWLVGEIANYEGVDSIKNLSNVAKQTVTGPVRKWAQTAASTFARAVQEGPLGSDKTVGQNAYTGFMEGVEEVLRQYGL